MSQNITFNGVVYVVPGVGDDSWGQNLSDYLVAIPQGSLQKSGGIFTLSADVNFGANYGILSKYFTTRTATPATAGILRLSLTDTIAWRNNANTNNLLLAVNGTDQLTFNGTVIQTAGNYLTDLTGDVTATGPGSAAATIGANKVLNSMIRQSAGLSLIGRAANSLGNVADITAGTDNTVLLRSGASLIFNLLTNNNIDPAAAIAYTKLALTGSIVNADISASAAIVYSKLNLASSILNSDISGSAAIAYSKLNLSAAILNADIAAGAAIAHSKMAALTASRALVSDGTGIVAVSATTATELGFVSGVTSSIQTQLGTKAPTAGPTFTGTITTPLTASRALVTGAASELGVSAVTATELGYVGGVTSALQTQLNGKLTNPLTTTGDIIYASSGSTAGRLGVGSSGQVLKVIGGAPSWSTFSGGINYASANPDAEADTSGWATYANGAAVPTTGTGGTPTATFTRSTASPLRGTASFLYTVGALGNGVSFAFTIDSADQAKSLQVSFDWAVTGAIAEGDYSVYVYDITNAVLSQIIPYKIASAVTGTQYSFKGSFQTASNSTSYRLIVHQTVATPAGNLKLDNVYIGPQGVSYTAPMTDWTSYTPTITGLPTSSVAGKWRRVGDTMEVMVYAVASGAATSNINASIPSGYSVDTNKEAKTPFGNVGIGQSNNGSLDYIGQAYVASATTLGVAGPNTVTWNATTPFTWASGHSIQYNAVVPITGWSSSAAVSQSDSAEGRIIASRYYVGTGASTAAAVPINYDTLSYDRTGSVTTGAGAWKYTATAPGVYVVSGTINSSAVATYYLYKNGVQSNYLITGSTNTGASYSTSVSLNAGDYIDIRSDSTITPNGGATGVSSISVSRVAGNQSITASETVAERWTTSAGAAVGTSAAVVTFATKSRSTHGAFSGSTFTAPVAGTYSVKVHLLVGTVTLTTTQQITGEFWKNGSIYSALSRAKGNGGAGQYYSLVGTDEIYLLAGETIQIAAQSDVATNLYTDARYNYVSIIREGN